MPVAIPLGGRRWGRLLIKNNNLPAVVGHVRLPPLRCRNSAPPTILLVGVLVRVAHVVGHHRPATPRRSGLLLRNDLRHGLLMVVDARGSTSADYCNTVLFCFVFFCLLFCAFLYCNTVNLLR